MTPSHRKGAPKPGGLVYELARDERGATAVEYSLILVAIAAAIVLVLTQIGPKVLGLFSSVNDDFPEP